MSIPDPTTLEEDEEQEEEDEEEGAVSERALEIIDDLVESGDSQALAVGECLQNIADGGEADDEYLAGCALEIALSAVTAANDLAQGADDYIVVRKADYPHVAWVKEPQDDLADLPIA